MIVLDAFFMRFKEPLSAHGTRAGGRASETGRGVAPPRWPTAK